MDIETIKRIGTRAAYRAGRILSESFGKEIRVNKKGAIDLVTEADIASEKMIVATIREVFPDHAFLAEESGASGAGRDHLWIIDPLDGTTNYAHGLPVFAVSIAYAVNDQITFGIVFNPVSGESFAAVRGGGAFLNGNPIQVSSTKAIGDSLLVTGFSYKLRTTPPDLPLARFSRCLLAAQGIRRLGSAALDLCYVACGRFDGFWEADLKPWDTAAGMLIALEAGASVTDFANRPYTCYDNDLLATNGRIHNELVGLLTIEDS